MSNNVQIFFGKNYDDWSFRKIKPTITAKQAWDILETAYQGRIKEKIVKLQALRREFENLKLKDSDSVEQFSNCVMNVVNQIRMNGDELIDQKVVEKILRSFPLNLIILWL